MGAVDSFKIMPDNYNPSLQNIQWGDIVPDFQLPGGKIFLLRKGSTWSKELAFRKGVTHLSKYDIVNESNAAVQALISARKTYDEVPNTAELMNLPVVGADEWAGVYPNSWNKMYFPNGYLTYEQGYDKGMNSAVGHAIIIPQVMENTTYTNPDAPMWQGYYDAKASRLNQVLGVGNWLMCRDYLYSNLAPDLFSVTESQAKDFVRNPATLPGYDRIISGTAKHHNLHTIPVYAGGLDWDFRFLYNIAYGGKLHKAVGHKSVVFPTPLREWRPNNYSGMKMPEGTLFRQDKVPLATTLNISLAIFAFAFADGLIGWGDGSKVSVKQWATAYMGDGGFWVKNGDPITAHQSLGTWPHFNSHPYTYTMGTYSGAEDAWSFGAVAYASTVGKTAGGTRRFAQFKIDNGGWYNPVNQYADDEVRAQKNNLPLVFTEVKDGLMSWFYCDPKGTAARKQLTFVGQNGQQYYTEVQGSLPRMGVIQI